MKECALHTLTVQQPWAELIASGIKLVENRCWSTDYRGPLAIHAAKTRDLLKDQVAREWPAKYGIPLPDA